MTVVALWTMALLVAAGGAFAASGGPAGRASAPLQETTVIDISATSTLSFEPNQVTAVVGQPIEFDVIQLANFPHTFTLSSVANYTIPPAATASDLATFFNAHPPLVNLTLGMTPGAIFQATIAPPALGSYEFVCLEPTHFQSGMHGVLLVQNASPSSSGSSSNLYLYIGVGAAVLVVAVIAAVLLIRRRPPKPPS